jgi:hypothetical protein
VIRPKNAAAVSRRTWWARALPVAAALAAALVGATTAFGEDAPALECTMTFQLKSWSAIYERADGSGTVKCSDGTSMPVIIHARGAGLSVGKSRIEHGTGRFADVRRISQVPGSYVQGDLHVGVAKSAAAEVLTNGKVSLALAGSGAGYDLGVGIADFTIRAAE